MMNAYQESILEKRIKGLTWGVILTIITVFGGGAVWIIRSYVSVQVSLDRSNTKFDYLEKKQAEMTSRMDKQEERLDNLTEN